jgi:hypothetical protein
MPGGIRGFMQDFSSSENSAANISALVGNFLGPAFRPT